MRSPSAPRIWPWLKSRLEWLALGDHAQVGQGLAEEAAVEQVHDGVFGAAGVLVNGAPALLQRAVDGGILRVRREVAPPVPGAVHEGVHGVRLAARRRAAGRAGGGQEGLRGLQRVAAAGRIDEVLREQDRQLRLRHRHDAAAGAAVDDRDGRAPGALAAHQPVTDAIGDGGTTLAACLQVAHDGGEPLRPGQAAVGAAVDQPSGSSLAG